MASDFRSIESDDLEAITPSDDAGAGQKGPYNGFHVGSISGGAAVKIRTLRGHDVVVSSVIAGLFYPYAFQFIWKTGTTATSLLGGRAVGDVL